MTHASAIRKWLSAEEIIKTDTDELRALYSKSLIHMSSMQRDLVENMLAGKMSDNEAARQAGYCAKRGKKDKTACFGAAARKSKGVVHALHIGRELNRREGDVSIEWIRSELKELLKKAKDSEDNNTVINIMREFSKLTGAYATEQLKVMHANSEGGPLSKEVSDDEWLALASLQHEIRKDDNVDGEFEMVDGQG